ncbi:MAG: response regulator transcription factor [Saprospiraceae bacterium]|nr:response regulator transcription factor [Saprospiraceae bacterium]
MNSVKVVIAEDHHVFCEGLKAILSMSEERPFEVVGEAKSGKDLLVLLWQNKADLVFLDLNLPEGDGLEVLPEIKKKFPDTRVIALTMFDDPKIVKSAFKSGLDGYILKGNPIEEVFEAVDEVLTGQTFMGTGVVLNLLPGENGPRKKKERSSFTDKFMQKYHLTAREIEVLQLISQALSNKEIAKALFISDQTVSVHRKNIMRKLGVSNTAALLKVAYENDLV